MARYIDADKLPIKVWNGDFVGVSKNDIEQTPTEEVTPIVQGKWINTMGEEAYCSNCNGYWFSNITKRMAYCPDCGCKMVEWLSRVKVR